MSLRMGNQICDFSKYWSAYWAWLKLNILWWSVWGTVRTCRIFINMLLYIFVLLLIHYRFTFISPTALLLLLLWPQCFKIVSLQKFTFCNLIILDYICALVRVLKSMSHACFFEAVWALMPIDLCQLCVALISLAFYLHLFRSVLLLVTISSINMSIPSQISIIGSFYSDSIWANWAYYDIVAIVFGP